MATAVVRVMIDPEGRLTGAAYGAGLRMLERSGFEVIASPAGRLPERRREIELIVEDGGGELRTGPCLDACRAAFGIEPELGVITYVSRGTDDDARGVLRRFGLAGEVVRTVEGDEEIVTVALPAEAGRRVPESRLHTALEAALNCEVRIVTASG
ncbi:hypothetical protein [Spirillospora sp. NPDC029432]|uniref:hypothetical protein n=1 Tax=Spirillospora sp. NPDC029432 TaxID=3154599 RepID=UPI0034539DA2